MSHRYPTRFQLKKAHTAQPAPLQAPPLQVQSRQADVIQDELTLMKQQADSSAVVNYLLARVTASTSFFNKVCETIRLFEYLYEHPVLLTTQLRFKDATWHKMIQLEKELTDVLIRLPDMYNHDTRTNTICLLNLISMIRQKYY